MILAVLVALGYWYAETYGLYIGYPPFTPVFLWKYTGERTYEISLRGATDGIKVRVEGELRQGRFRVWISQGPRRLSRGVTFRGKFQHEFKWKLPPGLYNVHFFFEEASGWVKLDWVSTKFESW